MLTKQGFNVAKSSLVISHPYKDACILLPTKHQKSVAIAPHFRKVLYADVIEYLVDTDALGTFSGEVERKTSALECAKKM